MNETKQEEPCIIIPLSRARKMIPKQKPDMDYGYYYYNMDELDKLHHEIIDLVRKNEKINS